MIRSVAFTIGSAVIAIAFLSLRTGYDALDERARAAAEGMASGLQQSIDADIAAIENSLRNAVTHFQVSQRNFPNPRFINTYLSDQKKLHSEFEALQIADQSGIVRYGKGMNKYANLRGYDFFLKASEENANDLVVSGPLREPGTENWFLVFAQKITSAEGFAGVAFIQVSTSHFQERLSSVNVGPNGAATLRTTAMQLVARFTPGKAESGVINSINVSDQLQNALEVNPVRGSFVAKTALDRVERISAYRRVGERPLLVLVGLDRDQYFQPWRQQAILIMGLLALVLAALAGACALIDRAWKSKDAHARALAWESNRNHGLLLTASDGIHVLNRGGFLVEFSDLFASMLGYERSQLSGRHVSSWDANLDLHVIEHWLATFEIGQRRKFFTAHRRQDGSVIHVEIQSAGVQIDREEYIFCSARDITERRQMEKKLAASAHQIRDLYDNAPCGYHSLDPSGVVVHINATQLAWIGYSWDEVVGKMHITQLLTEEGRKAFGKYFPHIQSNGQVEGVELDLVCRDGGLRRVTFNSSAVLNEEGHFLRSRTVVFDITELHAAKARLSLLSREQKAMLDNEMIGIARIRDREIVWKNPAMDRIFGYRSNELLGMSTRKLHVDEKTYLSEGAAAYPILKLGGHYRKQIQMLRANGQRIWIDSNGALISKETGESLWMFTDITSLKQDHAQVEHLAFHDALTGLPNRLLLLDRLRQEIGRARRNGSSLAVCYLDLDGFKKVNDKFGHAAGDTVLIEVSRRLLACMRTHDTVSRLGGDEFVVLMTDLDDPAESTVALERVIAAVSAPIYVASRQEVSVSASIGVSFSPQDGTSPAQLLEHADTAMYAAKQAGKNQFCFHSVAALPS